MYLWRSCWRINKLSVVLAFGLNPNCSGFRIFSCSMNLFNLDCKIDANSLPKQLVRVIPLVREGVSE